LHPWCAREHQTRRDCAGRKRELRDHERGIGTALKPHPNRMPCRLHRIMATMSNDDNDNASDRQPSGAKAAAFPQGPVAFPNASAPAAAPSWLPPKY